MNQWWILFCLGILAAVGFTGERYGENRVRVQCDKHDEAQQQVTIDAQQHVIKQVQTQGQITQEVENAYHTGITAIDSLYATARVQPKASASAGVRSVPAAACGTQTSRKYRLTLKQCDEEEAKCNALWNWAQQQSAVK
jgi:hypothetical protein